MDFEAESALLWSESGAWRAVDKRGAAGRSRIQKMNRERRLKALLPVWI